MKNKTIEIETKVVKVSVPNYQEEVDRLAKLVELKNEEDKRIEKKVTIMGSSMIEQISQYLIALFDPFLDEEGRFKIKIYGASWNLHSIDKGERLWNVRISLSQKNTPYLKFKFLGRQFKGCYIDDNFGDQIEHSPKRAEFYSYLAESWKTEKGYIEYAIKQELEFYELNKETFLKANTQYEQAIDNFKI